MKGTVTFGVAMMLVLAGLVVFPGCGGGEKGSLPPEDASKRAEQLVSQREIDRQPPNSPQQALLGWWRDAQYANFTDYRRAFAKPVRREIQRDPNAGRALVYLSGAIRSAKPRIVEAVRTGPRTNLFAEISYRRLVGSTRTVSVTVPRAFTMVREGGRWRLADDDFVQATLPASLARSARTERQTPRGPDARPPRVRVTP